MGSSIRRLLAVACATACALAVLPVPPLHGAVRPPLLDYTVTTLPNGLRVVISEDHSSPIVHVQVWYHVGSKNERTGRTGFAHLFEHLMFKGSKNVPPEQHGSMIASVGGEYNAYTTEDATVFWETVPATYLPTALWLEADRMATLRIDEAVFKNEREVVKEERRMRIENQPFGTLTEIIYDQAFTVHPYKHPVIGSMEDLQAASVEDVRDFYRTYYVPENATVVLVGDVDSKEALRMVTQYFGPVPKAPRAIERNIPQEPKPVKERRITLEQDWPLPVVVVAHPVTFDGNPDSYPLHVASKVLSDGQSSRIHKKLVYEERVAAAAFGGGNLIEHPNLFYAVAMVLPGHSPEKATEALIGELERLKREPISDQELNRVKNQFARDYILGRESIREKAGVLGHASVIHNDLKTADGEFDIFLEMTKEDVQRVARTYFTPETRLVLTILPRRGGQGAAGLSGGLH